MSDKLTKVFFELSKVIFTISLRTEEVSLGWKRMNISIKVEKTSCGVLDASVSFKSLEIFLNQWAFIEN